MTKCPNCGTDIGVAQTMPSRDAIANALAHKWPGDYSYGDPAEGANDLAFETADVVLTSVSSTGSQVVAQAMSSTAEGLADFVRLCRAYLDDAPGAGGHSDAAGSNAYELIEEAIAHCSVSSTHQAPTENKGE